LVVASRPTPIWRRALPLDSGVPATAKHPPPSYKYADRRKMFIVNAPVSPVRRSDRTTRYCVYAFSVVLPIGMVEALLSSYLLRALSARTLGA
jgi:hypothetical protein